MYLKLYQRNRELAFHRSALGSIPTCAIRGLGLLLVLALPRVLWFCFLYKSQHWQLKISIRPE